jgi:hypothetical protein
MEKSNLFLLVLIPLFSGCVSNSKLNKVADNHDKAGDYYESIGQPQVAEKSREMAQKKREESLQVDAILTEIFKSKIDK